MALQNFKFTCEKSTVGDDGALVDLRPGAGNNFNEKKTSEDLANMTLIINCYKCFKTYSVIRVSNIGYQRFRNPEHLFVEFKSYRVKYLF